MANNDTKMDPLFYKLFRLSSIIGFASSLIFHILILSDIVVLPIFSAVLICLLSINLWFAFVLQYSNSRMWRLMFQSGFSLDNRSHYVTEYYREIWNFWAEHTPIWAILIGIGLYVYALIRVLLAAQPNPVSLDRYDGSSLLSVLAALYWAVTWLWHTQLVRLEKSLAAEADPIPPPNNP